MIKYYYNVDEEYFFNKFRKSGNLFKKIYINSVQKRIRDYKIKKIANNYDVVIYNNIYISYSWYI